jgi:hypothetical protein
MKQSLIAVAAVAVLASGGCASSSPGDDATVKPGSGVALNPSGKPQTSADAAYASQMQQAGNKENADRQKDIDAINAAKARTGGK